MEEQSQPTAPDQGEAGAPTGEPPPSTPPSEPAPSGPPPADDQQGGESAPQE